MTGQLRVVRDLTAELDRLRAIEAAARYLVDSVDRRTRAGWKKTPYRDVERLRAALDGRQIPDGAA